MRNGVIYLATVNADVDKCYIGYTGDYEKRKREHLSAYTDSHFHRAIRKYGADTVTWQILEEDIPEHRLSDREELWIAFYNTYHNGLNMTEGGQCSQMTRPEVAAKSAATRRAQAARGEHPTQLPEVQVNISRGSLMGRAHARLKRWKTAGQQFIVDMTIGDK